MSAPDRIDFDRSRAVLIGTSAYTDGLEPMPAAANSLSRMEDLLTGLCGWPSPAVTSFKDLSTGDRRLRKVSGLIEEATDVLLLYYVGHGLLLPGDDLGLALTDTDANAALHLTTTYRLRTLREQLRYHCHARLKLIILDCCFAGIATRNAQEGPGGLADRVDHASRIEIEGTYTWTASRASQQAVYEDGDGGLTYFTKILYEVVASGIPGDSAWLTLADVDFAVARRFKDLPLADIRPEPTRLAAGGQPGMFPFAPNRAFTPVSPVTHIMGQALSVAESVTDEDSRARGLAIIAKAVAATDPDQAARLITDAERIAAASMNIRATESITSSLRSRAHALAAIAWAAAATDPDRAERIAQSITLDEYWKAMALAAIAVTVAATDPDRAERIAQSIAGAEAKAMALASVAEMVAATDPDRAERIAQSIPSNMMVAVHESAVSIALWAVAADPDPPARLITGAERIAQSIPSMGSKASALGAIAKAPAFPGEGSQLLVRILSSKASALASVAEMVAATDPDRAERIAQSITLETYKPMALVMVAEAVAATDPDQAARLAADAERIAQSIYFKDSEALALVMMAAATADSDRAARLAADAERIAQSIPDKGSKAMALASVAAVVAAADPDRAERIATSIPSLGWKAMALVMVAEAVAATDPERAALLITYADRVPRSSAFKSLLVRIAKFYAVDDPDYAERIALSITPDIAKISALVEIAETLSKS